MLIPYPKENDIQKSIGENMLKYALKIKPEKSAKVYGSGLRVSTKNATIVCKAVNGMQLQKAKKFLEAVIVEEREINGRYYTKTTATVLDLIHSAEKNAEFKGLDTDKLFVHVAAQSGYRFYRPRRMKMRGQRRKVSNLQVVLEQR